MVQCVGERLVKARILVERLLRVHRSLRAESDISWSHVPSCAPAIFHKDTSNFSLDHVLLTGTPKLS